VGDGGSNPSDCKVGNTCNSGVIGNTTTLILNINERFCMAKRKHIATDQQVTESDCQRLVKEVHTEERVKLEERFKEAYKDSKQILDKKTKWVEFCKERLVEANKELSNAEENLNELETADLDQWGKDNPEKTETVYVGMDFGYQYPAGAVYSIVSPKKRMAMFSHVQRQLEAATVEALKY
jgi:hypothetical protein